MVEVTLIEAARRAALQAIRRDERARAVFVEDAARGGLWRQHKETGAVAWSR